MRIVQVNAVPNGSTGTLARQIHTFLLREGHDSLFAYSSGKTEMPNTFIYDTQRSIKVHGFLSRLTGLQGYWSYRSTKRLVKQIRAFKPDVVHIHNIHANNLNYSKFFRFLAKQSIGLCITLHDCYMFTGHCCYYTAAECEKWTTQCHSCPQMKMYNKSWIFDTSKKAFQDKKHWCNMQSALAVVGVSKWISGEAKRSLLKNAQLSTYVYNWIDHDVFYPKNAYVDARLDGKFVILGVAQSWSDSKGLPDFEKLSEKLREDEIVVLVGRCDKALPENIVNIERTENASVLAEIYSRADVFANPSKQETFGLVTAEALSCGTPVVVYNNTAMPELVGEGCGFVCENGNVDEMYKLISIVRQTGKAAYLNHCVSFARANFSREKNIKAYVDVYRSLKGRESQ